MGFIATNFATAPHQHGIMEPTELRRTRLDQDADLSLAMDVLAVVFEHALLAAVDVAYGIRCMTKVLDILPNCEIRLENCVISMLIVELQGKSIRP